MKRLVLVGLLMLVPCLVYGQTSPQVTWVQGNVLSATQAQGFTYKLYVTPAGTTTPLAPVTLASILCGGNAPTVQCSTVLPTAASQATITGSRSELTAQDTTGTESGRSAPFTTPASVPTSLLITR